MDSMLERVQELSLVYRTVYRRSCAIVTDPRSMLEGFAPVVLPRWTPSLHHLFLPPTRARAVELLLAGYLLAREGLLPQGSLQDVWVEHVMPAALERRSAAGSRAAANGDLIVAGDPLRYKAKLAERREARDAERARQEALEAEKQQKKAARKRERTAGASGAASGQCAKCGSSPPAKACEQQCCGACCSGPCRRHKK